MTFICQRCGAYIYYGTSSDPIDAHDAYHHFRDLRLQEALKAWEERASA